jgi:hypothetical protein
VSLIRNGSLALVCALCTLAATRPAAAQDPAVVEATTPPEAAAAPAQLIDEDERLDPAQPDYTLVSLPTTLRLPNHNWAFRVTHRFTRPLGQGDFGDLLDDFFGFDNSALIGLEMRFGLAPGLQAGIHRTSGDKTIQFFGQYSILTEGEAAPLGLDAFVTVEGVRNFRDDYAPSAGVLLSRKVSNAAAFYLEPIWVGNANPLPDDLNDDDNALLMGLGGRVRIRPTVYLVAEVAPRIWGFDGGVTHGSLAIEKRVGGHAFQVNVSNSFGTTMAQIARGGFASDDWYIGFNISRKFY